MATALLTLAGTIAGAIIGLMAPFFSTKLATRHEFRVAQGQLASEIIDLFQDSRQLDALLTPSASETRRKLYLLAIRLSNEQARQSCMKLIAYAGDNHPDSAVLLNSWNEMITIMGSVYRSSEG
jgi:hypothetical protein